MSSKLESFMKLRELAANDGFWEVIAYICLRDTFIHLSSDKLTRENFHQSFDKGRLSQTEISTLIGLACKNRTTVKLLSANELKTLLLETDNLWKELHFELIKDSILREAIFYSGNGVYKHQYRDLAKIRYHNDDVWIKENKGFNLSEVVRVFTEIENIILEKLNAINVDNNERSFLSFFSFTIDDLVDKTSFSIETVEAILSAFSVVDIAEGMSSFNAIDDFNHRNAYPIIKINDKYVSFQSYSLWESLYESPFFWFNSDAEYKSLASKNL